MKKAKNGRPMRPPKVTPVKVEGSGGAVVNGEGATGVGGEMPLLPRIAGEGGEAKAEGEGEGKAGEEKKNYNRKEKSLGLLCDKSDRALTQLPALHRYNHRPASLVTALIASPYPLDPFSYHSLCGCRVV